ncbi:rhamnogalacturonan lyase [Clavibacter sp. VKM Ac-2873]|uniref:rhamnogalacturonan lyase n=1 Tax=Clavibacter sp. VKM Ac-2873 TaxID=2783813 RepID=UPI00351C2B51
MPVPRRRLRRALVAALVAGAVAVAQLPASAAPAEAAGDPGATAAPSSASATAASGTGARQMERLDRAPEATAVPGGVHLSWRMLGTDPDAIAFVVDRDGSRITPSPLTDATDLLDPDGGPDAHYVVSSVLDGVEAPVTGSFGVRTGPYTSVPLDRPADGVTPTGESYGYSANDTSVGDADGDGQYELFVKWDPSDSKDNSQAGYTGPVLLDAYRLDGTRLWRIDLGPNIRAGAHYTQFQVYDYDGDGRAEVAMKTADGTVDGQGNVLGDASADHRNPAGRVLEGPESLTVFDGLTGAVIDSVPYDPPRGAIASWGDTYGNRVDRFLAATAYLDGERPSLIVSRGYYARTAIAAYDLRDGHLVERWILDSATPGNAAAAGEGDHAMEVADVDGDGRDEIVFGSMTVDDDGTLLYSTGLGHGDALHVADLVPDDPGYEVFAVHEIMSRSGDRAATMRDARTGRILWSIPGDHDTGRGSAADVDPRHPGAEAWASGLGPDGKDHPQLRSADGDLIANRMPGTVFTAWWDGDPLREIVDDDYDASIGAGTPLIAKWDWATATQRTVLRADGALSDNGTKGDPMLQADLMGDWREELVWRSADSSELRIYSTTDQSDMRLRTLMQDPVYRLAVAWQNTGYDQPPEASYFIGAGMGTPPVPRIRLAGPDGGPADAPADAAG